MTCSSTYASAAEYNEFFCLTLDITDPDTLANVTRTLALAASDVNAALSAAGACSCTLASWAADYVKKLQLIDSSVIYRCPCGPHLSDEERRLSLEWLNQQFQLIRENKIDLCGQTGAESPAWGSINYNFNPFNAAQIISNRIDRYGS